MVDRDFESHLQDLFDAPVALDDADRFAALVARDVRRMRLTLLWVSALAAAGLAAGIYLALDPLWTRWSNEVVSWAMHASAAGRYSSMLTTGAAVMVAAVAATIGVVTGRRA